ncbi:MAG TPA: hypothetical protein PKY77_12960 [Phycisphaerae bacterium]|nr:hypothetical protein [Phycisphaerae bacterium]HRY68261.1 hypothetical protein [Phycisphaerae bacterium]HSA26856.1 hypothetical protein [Phycisphaerae bacterium]
MPRDVRKKDNPAWKSTILTAVLAPPCIVGAGMIAYFGLELIISTMRILDEHTESRWLSWSINTSLPILVCLAMAVHIIASFWLCRRIYISLRWKTVPYDRSWCLKCGYNLTGNMSGICPECGEMIVTE